MLHDENSEPVFRAESNCSTDFARQTQTRSSQNQHRIYRITLATGLLLISLNPKAVKAEALDGTIGNLSGGGESAGVGQIGDLSSGLDNIGGFAGGSLGGLGNLGGSGGLGSLGGLGNLGGSGGLGNLGGSGGLGSLGGLGNLGGSGGLGNLGGSGGLGSLGGLGNLGGSGGLGSLGGLGNLGGSGGMQSIFGSIGQRISGYLTVFQGYFQNHLSSVLGGLFNSLLKENGEGNQAGGQMPDVAGVLGIPDSQQTQTAIQQRVDKTGTQGFPGKAPQQSDAFNHNPVALTRSLSFEADRVTTRGISSSAVGKDGQTAMQQQLEAVGQIQQGISSADQKSQGMDVTQDVMKQLALMVDGSSNIQTSLYAQAEMARVQQAANGIIQSNISEAIDEVNRTHHAETIGGASAVLVGGANIYLPGMKKKQ